MAMLHPDDSTFAKSETISHKSIIRLFQDQISVTPSQITSPSSNQGAYHKVYFLRIPPALDNSGTGTKWSGKEVVLRVARSVSPSQPLLDFLRLMFTERLSIKSKSKTKLLLSKSFVGREFQSPKSCFSALIPRTSWGTSTSVWKVSLWFQYA
jgi:hypothetical protein